MSEIVRRRSMDEPSARGFCFQSNAAIRARPTDDDSGDADLELDRQAHISLDALADSDLLRRPIPASATRSVTWRQPARQKAPVSRKAARAMIAEARAFSDDPFVNRPWIPCRKTF